VPQPSQRERPLSTVPSSGARLTRVARKLPATGASTSASSRSPRQAPDRAVSRLAVLIIPAVFPWLGRLDPPVRE
jgi:hypothetical protein